MFKSVFGTASMLGLAGMLSFSGCSSDGNGSGVNGNGSEQNGATGGIGLALQLADGSDVSTVNYTVTRNGSSVRTGELAIGADGRATGTITGLDAGAGYVVSLSAPRTRDGGSVAACTGESAPFTVLENETVPVSVVLQCDDTSAGGNITINGQFNICPKVTSASASPSSQAVGSTTRSRTRGSPAPRTRPRRSSPARRPRPSPVPLPVPSRSTLRRTMVTLAVAASRSPRPSPETGVGLLQRCGPPRPGSCRSIRGPWFPK